MPLLMSLGVMYIHVHHHLSLVIAEHEKFETLKHLCMALQYIGLRNKISTVSACLYTV